MDKAVQPTLPFVQQLYSLLAQPLPATLDDKVGLKWSIDVEDTRWVLSGTARVQGARKPRVLVHVIMGAPSVPVLHRALRVNDLPVQDPHLRRQAFELIDAFLRQELRLSCRKAGVLSRLARLRWVEACQRQWREVYTGVLLFRALH